MKVTVITWIAIIAQISQSWVQTKRVIIVMGSHRARLSTMVEDHHNLLFMIEVQRKNNTEISLKWFNKFIFYFKKRF